MDSAGVLMTTLALKFSGAFAGAVLALVFLPPKSRGEFVRRAVLSLIAGLIFADPLRDWLKWPETWQMDLAAATAVAMLSWFVIGAAVRIIGSWKQK
jgi:hypothetical protein